MTTTTSGQARAGSRSQLGTGVPAILVGLACWVMSRVVDSGFVPGLFLGAGIALMVLGAYLVGSSLRSSRRSGDGAGRDGDWLPSRDGGERHQGKRPRP